MKANRPPLPIRTIAGNREERGAQVTHILERLKPVLSNQRTFDRPRNSRMSLAPGYRVRMMLVPHAHRNTIRLSPRQPSIISWPQRGHVGTNGPNASWRRGGSGARSLSRSWAIWAPLC